MYPYKMIKEQSEGNERLKKEAMKPRLVDRADGVKGHYSIARTRPEGFVEYWNAKQAKWCSAGTVIELTE
jgi:hypothetical protein